VAPDGQIAMAKASAAAPASISHTVAASLAGSALQWSAFLCFAAATLLWLGPYLWRVDLVSEDATQHVFWFWRWVDSAFLTNDPAADYFSSPAVAPPGYRALYAMVVPLLGPQLAGEIVAIGLLALSCGLAWMLGTSLGEKRSELRGLLAVVATLALVAMPRPDLLSPMGFQRSFALPITLLVLWALVARRYAWVGVGWLGAALFYPVIVPVLGLAGVAVFLLETLRERRLPRAWFWNALAGVGAIVIVLSNSVPLDWVGPQVTLEQARAMPEFGPGGRLDMTARSPAFWFRDHRYGIGWPVATLGVFALAAVFVRVAGRSMDNARQIPKPAWMLAGAGLLLFAISHLTLFHLYLPNRHTRTSIAVFGIVAIVAAVSLLVEKTRGSVEDARTNRVGALVAPIAVALLFLPLGLQLWRQPVDENLERIYQAIGALPVDTIVAAHPDLANYVTLRTGRSVLASSETALPFMPRYYDLVQPRLVASLRAAHAPGWTALSADLATFPADVMLLGPAPASPRLGEPFDSMQRELEQLATLEQLLVDLPPGQVIARSGSYVLVRLEKNEPGILQVHVAAAARGAKPQ
jgi:hypothetical protein